MVRKKKAEAVTATVTVEEKKHAMLAPSDAKRWLTCSGSIYMESLCPEPESSAYADEGSHAHAVAEKVLDDWLLTDIPIEEAFEKYADLCTDAEMQDCVLEYCLTAARLMMKCRPDWVAVEKRLILIPNVNFGTADVVFTYEELGKRRGVIIDLKYGQGHAVDAVDNPQLANYACALDADEEHGDLYTVDVFIFQPRAEHPDGPLRSWRLNRTRLDHWREKLEAGMKEALYDLEHKTPRLKVDEDGCRWCAAIAICKAYSKHINGAAGLDFDVIAPPELKTKGEEFKPDPPATVECLPDPHRLTPRQLGRLVLARAEIEAYLKRVEEFAVNLLKSGCPIEGLKLVAGRSARKWIDRTQSVAESLRKAGVQKPFQAPKLIGITEAEKELKALMSLKDVAAFMDSLTEKPEPSPKVVSDRDPREALPMPGNSAASDFKEEK